MAAGGRRPAAYRRVFAGTPGRFWAAFRPNGTATRRSTLSLRGITVCSPGFTRPAAIGLSSSGIAACSRSCSAPRWTPYCNGLNGRGWAGYDEAAGTGLLRHVYIRQAEATGEVMVCLVCTSGKLPQAKGLIAALQEAVPGLASLVVNVNRRATNVILGPDTFTLWGKDAITDELCGLRFRLSPQSFYQVNRRQAEELYRLAGEEAGLTGKETLLDLYCGTGTIGADHGG